MHYTHFGASSVSHFVLGTKKEESVLIPDLMKVQNKKSRSEEITIVMLE